MPSAFSQRSILGIFLLASQLASGTQAWGDAPRLSLQSGDHVVIVGDQLVTSLVEFGYFESLLLASKPDSKLVVRYATAPESSTASDRLVPWRLPLHELTTQLKRWQTDVILLCFGHDVTAINQMQVDDFGRELETLVAELSRHSFHGTTPPRIACVSPISLERIVRDANLPPIPVSLREPLADRIAAVAARLDASYVDLFHPTRELVNQVDHVPWAEANGQLSDYGAWALSQILLDQLRWLPKPHRCEVDVATGAVRAEGMESSRYERREGGWRFALVDITPPAPAPPTVLVQEIFLAGQPQLVVKQLPAGQYELRSRGRTIHPAAPPETWEQGIPLLTTEGHRLLDELRQAVNAKNRRTAWRPGATRPQSVPTGDFESRLWELAERRGSQSWELVPAESHP